MPTDGPSAVLPVFEAYQRARLEVTQAVAEMAVPPTQRPGADAKVSSAVEAADYAKCIEALENYSRQLAQTLTPLCYDIVPGVQSSAFIALSRLARASDKLAAAVAGGALIPHICQLLSSPMTKRDIKLSAAHLLLQIARDPELATQVVEAGAIATLIENFEGYDPQMKTAALWVLGTCASTDRHGAAAVVDAGVVRIATLSLGEPHLPVQRVAASLLADVCKHEEDHARLAHEAGGAMAIAPLLSSRCPIVRGQACRCLAQMAKYGKSAGERVPPAMFPTLVQLMRDADDDVAQNAATVVRELAKFDERTAGRLVEAGALRALLEVLTSGRGSPAPAAAALGFLGQYTEQLADDVVECGAVPVLSQGLRLSAAPHVRAIVANSLAGLGKKSPEAAAAIARAGTMPVLQALSTLPDEAQKAAADKAIAFITPNIIMYEPLLEMVDAAQHAPHTLPVPLQALAALLAEAEDAGRLQAHFVASGHMRALQAKRAGADPRLKKAIDAFNATFPEEVVEQLQPGYEDGLIARIGEGEEED